VPPHQRAVTSIPIAISPGCHHPGPVRLQHFRPIYWKSAGLNHRPTPPQTSLYAFIIAEPLGFLLNQNAFQESSLIAPVLAIRTVTDPLVAIGIGLVWLNETITSSPGAIAAEVAGLVILSVGVVALAYRSPHLDAQSSRPTLSSQPPDGAQRP
jgi:hypothetical protein